MKISIKEARNAHDKLREILIKYNAPEFGDCIVDEISWLFNFPTTIDTETKGNLIDGGDYQLLDYTFKAINTEDGFTNIEVRDFNDDVVGEIAGLEIPDEFDDEAVIEFEGVLLTWLKGKNLV